jgi:hypothetical protein
VHAGPDARAAVTLGEVAVAVGFDVSGGHVAPDARARIVAEVFALPALRNSQHLRAAVPLGDTELLVELRRRCPALSTRAAGSTCLVDAELDSVGSRP